VRWFLFLLLILGVARAEHVPRWAFNYDSPNKEQCVPFAKDLAKQAKRDNRQIYFIVGFTNNGRPHAFVVVDGWAIDNGALEKRVFPESDIDKYMRKWWIENTLPARATLRIDEHGHKEVYEGN